MNDAGIEIWPGLIIGMPGETEETVRLTVEGCIRHNIRIDRWSYAFATPYPGTELYTFAKESGLITDEWQYIQRLNEVGDTTDMAINLTKFSDAKLMQLKQQAIKEVNRRRCMGLSEKKTGSALFQVPGKRLLATLKKVAAKGRRFNRKLCQFNRKNPFACVQARHLASSPSETMSKSLFKKSIRLVEIEVFSFCNRTCWFCPNSYIDRRSENQFMPEPLYRKILENLQDIDYKETISYSRYNEPLADPIIFERLELARTMVPNAVLHFNTNGDYFNKDILHQLYDSGLRSLNIQVYLPGKSPYSDKLAAKLLMERLTKYNLTFEFGFSRPLDWLEYHVPFKDMKIRIYARNFSKNGSDRGAAIQELSQDKIRHSPCLVPFTDIYIDYNGKVVPCCNIRSDIEAHTDFVLGDLNDKNQSLFTIFQSPTAAAFRKNLIGFHAKDFPCDRCNFAQLGTSAVNYKRAERLLKKWYSAN
jgi:MoaA/NifB/PqqE/SkfB family radical SAM enzyme